MRADIENGVGAVEDGTLAQVARTVHAMLPDGTDFVLVCFNMQGGASYVGNRNELIYAHVLRAVLANLEVKAEGLDDRAQNN